MRFEVPQFIEVEDKIVGPFTWRQFVYLAGGAGAGIMCYILLPFILFVLIAGPIAALACGLAFYPVNNRPFSVFLESVARYIVSARLYLWKKQDVPLAQRAAQGDIPLYTPPTSNTIATLSRKLELNALQAGLGPETGKEIGREINATENPSQL